MTITISQIGADGYWTGAALDIEPEDPCPKGWTRSPLPELGEGETVRWNGRIWVVVGAEELTERLRELKLEALAARRWLAETGGIMLGEMSIKTDEDTQRKITGAYVKADKDAGFSARWKIAPGVFVTLDAATILMIGDAVTAHIQTCFDNEADITADILAAADEAELDAIDIETGWPA